MLYKATGGLQSGYTSCQAGELVCLPLNPSADEVCDGEDNDCDGQIDEDNPGGNIPCTTNDLESLQSRAYPVHRRTDYLSKTPRRHD